MPLLDHMLTTNDIAIQRAGVYEDGGDRSRITIYTGLRAKIVNDNTLTIDERARSSSNVTRFLMRHLTQQGEDLDIQEGDEISWPDWRGDRQISRVEKVIARFDGFGGRIDHLDIEALG